jgi:hypothetical protein
VGMAGSDSNSNKLLIDIIANSLFTPRQMSIISKRLQGAGKPPNMTSGAYYRQVKQCRDKAVAAMYSVILLQSSGALAPEALSAMARLADQLSVIFASEGSDIFDQTRMQNVMSVMDTLVKRMCKL